MPREHVMDETQTFALEVGWSRDGGLVEVATTDRTGGAERVIGMVNEWLAAAGMPMIDYTRLCEALGRTMEHPAGGQLSPAFSGWHAHLTRWAVNEHIRNLRRARDQAFGRDE